jgi:hypothetical protein
MITNSKLFIYILCHGMLAQSSYKFQQQYHVKAVYFIFIIGFKGFLRRIFRNSSRVVRFVTLGSWVGGSNSVMGKNPRFSLYEISPEWEISLYENPVVKILLMLVRWRWQILPEEIPDDVEEIPEWNSVSGQEDFVSGRVLRDRYDKILRSSLFQ